MGDVDRGNVISWTARPRRAKKPPPMTYWEEYVETDEFYLEKLLEDVPASEMHAACFDEDFQHDRATSSECEGDESASGSGDETDASFVCSESATESEYISSDSDSGSTSSSDAHETDRASRCPAGEAEA